MESGKTFEDAIRTCPVRGAIYLVPFKKYWKNHPTPLVEQVPIDEQRLFGWKVYDPRDNDEGSLYMFND